MCYYTLCAVQDYLFYHLPWGVPQGSDDRACLLAHFYYIIKYSTFYHIPLWVAYKLNGSVRSFYCMHTYELVYVLYICMCTF